MITETDTYAAGIDLAARTWPEESTERTALLRHIIDEGIQSLQQKQQNRIQQRQAAIAKIQSKADLLANMWPENWNELRLAEWPE